MVAIVFASLAPGISHALVKQSAPLTLWQEICTAQGTKMMASVIADTNHLQEPQPLELHVGALEHCPFCSSPHADVTAPPGDHVQFVVALNATESPDEYRAPFVQAYLQSAHLSRAPPVPLK
jgi:hypothetical protein